MDLAAAAPPAELASDVEALRRLATALCIGLLVGIDRERAEERHSAGLFAGIRTFPLIALTGGIAAWLLPVTGVAFLATAFLAVAAIAGLSYFRAGTRGQVGATTEIAAILTFLLGALAGLGQLVVAAAAGVAVAVLLAAKPRLEQFSRAITPAEISSALELAVVTVIVLPLLPDLGYGPGGVLNPREIWTVVVLVAALSFTGFVAVRLLGTRKGTVVTGAVGGLVSSTAVTLAMAARSKEQPSLETPAAAAAALASTITALRVSVLVGVVDLRLLPRVLPFSLAMFLAGGLVVRALLRRAGAEAGGGEAATVANPFRLRTALGFAAGYAVVLLVVRLAGDRFGAAGQLASAALAGATDVDAVTIALSRIGPGSDGGRTIGLAVALAVLSNTVVKTGMALALGSRGFGRAVLLSLGGAALAGGAAAAAVWLGA